MKHVTVLLVALLLVCSAGMATNPHIISHQGYVADPTGTGITATLPMTFKIFDAPTGGAPLWTQVFPSVTVTRGVFTVNLLVDTVHFTIPTYLETTIDGEILTPRTAVTGAPFSLAPWASIGSDIHYNSGNVGIGTTTPSAMLDIVPTGSVPNLQLKSRLNTIISPIDDIQIRNPGDNNPAFRAFYASGLSTMGGYALQGYRRWPDGGALHLVGVCTDDQSTVDGAVIIRGQLNDAQDNLVNAPILDVENGDGTSLMMVGANGNVGIGTTTPTDSSLLHVRRDQNSLAEVRVENATSGSNAWAGFFAKADLAGGLGVSVFSTGFTPVLMAKPNSGLIRTDSPVLNGLYVGASSGPLTLFTSDVERISVTPAGNVGIGTTSPNAKLDVTGTILAVGGMGVRGDDILSPGYAGISSRMFSDVSTNSSQDVPQIYTLRGRGSIAAPAAVQSGDNLGEFQWGGQWGSMPGEQGLAATIRGTATENWSSGAHGTAIEFATIENGTAPYPSASPRMRIDHNGNVSIGTTSPGASNLLELSSTTKGLVLSRMTKTERNAITSPVAGMMVYQTDNTPGLRVYNGTNWMKFTESAD